MFKPTLRELSDALDDLWRANDELLAELSDDDWQRHHGSEWTMVDVPYHLAYFDRELVVTPIRRGQVPEGERIALRSFREVDEWNAEQFAKRPSGQSAAESAAEMQQARGEIRELVAGLSEADLDQPVWIPLMPGERTVRTALIGCAMHTWSEHMQLRLRLKRSGHLPSPATTHLALNGFMHAMPMGLNREAAAGKHFNARFVITGDGGGRWTACIDDGACAVSDDPALAADITMTLSPDAFVKMSNDMQNPMLMMLTRQLRVKGLRKLGQFGKLMPKPKPDTVLQASLVDL